MLRSLDSLQRFRAARPMFSVVPQRLPTDEALQAAMLLPESEALPDLRATTLDEILAVRVVVDHELDGSLVCDMPRPCRLTRRKIASST